MSDIAGLGSDIVECLRIAQMIERHAEQFVSRVYTPSEINYCLQRQLATQHYASFWAAKVAVLKALGTGWRRGIGFRDIEISCTAAGEARVRLSGAVLDLAVERGVDQVLVTLSHCRSHATAYAVALGKRRSDESGL